jgi:hypothetical protein
VGGAKSDDSEKVWSFTNPSLLSACIHVIIIFPNEYELQSFFLMRCKTALTHSLTATLQRRNDRKGKEKLLIVKLKRKPYFQVMAGGGRSGTPPGPSSRAAA